MGSVESWYKFCNGRLLVKLLVNVLFEFCRARRRSALVSCSDDTPGEKRMGFRLVNIYR